MICTTVQRPASYDTSHSSSAAEKRNSASFNSPLAVRSCPSLYFQVEHLPFPALFSHPPSPGYPPSAFRRKPVRALGIFRHCTLKVGKCEGDFVVDSSRLQQPAFSANMWRLAKLSGWKRYALPIVSIDLQRRRSGWGREVSQSNVSWVC